MEAVLIDTNILIGCIRNEARDLGVHFADLFIVATAMAHDCFLLTLNQKHVKGIKGLKLA